MSDVETTTTAEPTTGAPEATTTATPPPAEPPKPAAVVLRLNKGEAEGVVASFERLMRERDELREASRALLTDLEAPMGDLPIWCNYPRCRRLAMCNDGDQYACDEHQGMLVTPDVEDCSYAAPLRKLRALVEGP